MRAHCEKPAFSREILQRPQRSLLFVRGLFAPELLTGYLGLSARALKHTESLQKRRAWRTQRLSETRLCAFALTAMPQAVPPTQAAPGVTVNQPIRSKRRLGPGGAGPGRKHKQPLRWFLVVNAWSSSRHPPLGGFRIWIYAKHDGRALSAGLRGATRGRCTRARGRRGPLWHFYFGGFLPHFGQFSWFNLICLMFLFQTLIVVNTIKRQNTHRFFKIITEMMKCINNKNKDTLSQIFLMRFIDH